MPTKENLGERAGDTISFWERTAQKFRTAPLSGNLTADLCVVGGYASDYTRTFTTGFVEGPIKEVYALVLAAQQAGFDALRAGVRGLDADAAARRVVDATPFAGTFGHGLGHGLGLEVHEAPRLSTESTDTLAAGNVVTVEPGIYLDGRAGIRIEDNVVVTNGGIQNLTGFRKDLITVG